MTPVALFQLSGRVGLCLFGCESILLGIRLSLIRLPQDAIWRRSLGDRVFALLFFGGFGAGMIWFGLNLPGEQFTSTFGGFIAACTSPFWVAGAVAVVRYIIRDFRLAARIRRRQHAEQAAEVDHSNPNWTDH